MKRLNFKMLGLSALCAAMSAATSSRAADLLDDSARKLSFQAQLADGNGDPLVGLHTLTFNFYDDPDLPGVLPGGGPFDVLVDIAPEDNGVVAVLLPSGASGLPASLFDGAARYLGVAIDGGVELTPRIQIGVVPHAMRANRVESEELADNVDFGEASTSGLVNVFDSDSGAPSIALDGGSNLISLFADNGGQTIAIEGADSRMSVEDTVNVVEAIGGNVWAQMGKNGNGGGVFRTFDELGTEALEAGTSSFDGGGFLMLRQLDGSFGLTLDGYVPGKGGLITAYTSVATQSYEIVGDDGNGAGRITMYDGTALENNRVRIDAKGLGEGSELRLFNGDGDETFTVFSDEDGSALVALWNDLGVATLGLDADNADNGALIRLRNGLDEETITIDASKGATPYGEISLFRPGGAGGGPLVETIELRADETGTEGGSIKVRDVAGNTTVKLDGDFNGTGEGRVITDVLVIQGGADFSENFDVSAESVQPGMVVSIDPDNPGHLQISREPYDRKVAGVVSGAGGVRPGMLMGQSGSVADGAHPVALSGRVYCLVDASNGAVAPGDLLTTSSTPGHAMKVSDHASARGAVIGKAMSALKNGTGLVLVLVMPQ